LIRKLKIQHGNILDTNRIDNEQGEEKFNDEN